MAWYKVSVFDVLERFLIRGMGIYLNSCTMLVLMHMLLSRRQSHTAIVLLTCG